MSKMHKIHRRKYANVKSDEEEMSKKKPSKKVWVARDADVDKSRTYIYVYKPKYYRRYEFFAHAEGIILPLGKHLGLKPGECKRATLTID